MESIYMYIHILDLYYVCINLLAVQKIFHPPKKYPEVYHSLTVLLPPSAYWWEHVKYIPRLWKYMLPLFLVYWAEYMINQGFFELLYNPNTHVGSLCISQEAQYRL